jgi:hypothetical protein
MSNWWDEGHVPSLKRRDPESTVSINAAPIESLETLFEISHVANYFGVVVGTVYKWVMIGLIMPTRQGRDLRFTTKQIADCKHRRQHEWRKFRKESQLEKASG